MWVVVSVVVRISAPRPSVDEVVTKTGLRDPGTGIGPLHSVGPVPEQLGVSLLVIEGDSVQDTDGPLYLGPPPAFALLATGSCLFPPFALEAGGVSRHIQRPEAIVYQAGHNTSKGALYSGQGGVPPTSQLDNGLAVENRKLETWTRISNA